MLALLRPTKSVAEVTRLLRPDGRLVTCHFCWLPHKDEVARRSEALVLKYNSAWTGRDFSGKVVRERPNLAALVRGG